MVKSVEELIAGGMTPEMAKQYRKEAMQEIKLPSPAQYMKKMTDKQKIKMIKEKLGKTTKGVAGMGAMGMGSEKLKNLLKEAKMRKPSGRINKDDLFNADKYKMKKPKRAPMQKGPLGPLRPVRERSQSSRLIRTNARRPKR